MSSAGGNLLAVLRWLSFSQSSKRLCNFAASASTLGVEIGAGAVFEGLFII